MKSAPAAAAHRPGNRSWRRCRSAGGSAGRCWSAGWRGSAVVSGTTRPVYLRRQGSRPIRPINWAIWSIRPVAAARRIINGRRIAAVTAPGIVIIAAVITDADRAVYVAAVVIAVAGDAAGAHQTARGSQSEHCQTRFRQAHGWPPWASSVQSIKPMTAPLGSAITAIFPLSSEPFGARSDLPPLATALLMVPGTSSTST
jgi:hypothetical protein